MVWVRVVGSILGAGLLCSAAVAAPVESDPEFDELLSLDLADLTVTSVSKRPQRLADTAAAIYVVTQEDIRRTGAATIPDALRIVPGIQVAQAAANKWAVSARGFNSTTANKMLVMIDGRTVYTPVFSGTYWDDRAVPLEEIDRIEVIRGPGGSVWGANAMNGIIHIITKSGRDHSPDYVTASYGNQQQGITAGHSGKLNNDSYYRSYAGVQNYTHTNSPSGADNPDDWNRGTAGFRIDGVRGNDDAFTVTANAYGGMHETLNNLPTRAAPYRRIYGTDDDSYGGSVTGSFDKNFSADSKGTLRMSVDHYSRLEEIADQHISTLDIDWQHDIQTSTRNNFSWGLGYRFIKSDIQGSFAARVSQESRNFNLYSAFVQNEYALLENELYLTLGTKFEINEFTGQEWQPSARMTWRASDTQTVWASIGRAVRTPSIVEDDINLVVSTGPGPTYNAVFGNSGVRTETLLAYELGHRMDVTPTLQLDNTLYYNDYDHLLTFEAGTPYFTGLTFVNPYFGQNLGEGHVYGFESAAIWTTSPSHKLMGSYTFTEMDLNVRAGSNYNLDGSEASLPKHQFSLRSYWNVAPKVQFDNMLYYTDNLGSAVDAYLRYDARLSYQLTPGMDVSVTGYNLLDDSHPEFTSLAPAEIPRSALARVTVRF